ncbi:MAG: hypothetical protein WCX94_02535 [Candidatus Dojkabacteria bacterium]|jgi:hypothetical protein
MKICKSLQQHWEKIYLDISEDVLEENLTIPPRDILAALNVIEREDDPTALHLIYRYGVLLDLLLVWTDLMSDYDLQGDDDLWVATKCIGGIARMSEELLYNVSGYVEAALSDPS